MVVELVKLLLKNKRYNDLLDLLNETSEFTGSTVTNIPNTKDEIEFIIKANHHICFLSKYGNTNNIVIENGKVYQAYPEFFEKWLESGAKGIEECEIQEYLKHNPV